MSPGQRQGIDERGRCDVDTITEQDLTGWEYLLQLMRANAVHDQDEHLVGEAVGSPARSPASPVTRPAEGLPVIARLRWRHGYKDVPATAVARCPDAVEIRWQDGRQEPLRSDWACSWVVSCAATASACSARPGRVAARWTSGPPSSSGFQPGPDPIRRPAGYCRRRPMSAPSSPSRRVLVAWCWRRLRLRPRHTATAHSRDSSAYRAGPAATAPTWSLL